MSSDKETESFLSKHSSLNVETKPNDIDNSEPVLLGYKPLQETVNDLPNQLKFSCSQEIVMPNDDKMVRTE